MKPLRYESLGQRLTIKYSLMRGSSRATSFIVYMAVTLQGIRGQPETVMVLMNEVRSALWSSVRYLATEQLNSCTAIAILSNKAIILAHIAPRTPEVGGDENMQALIHSIT